MTNSVSSIQQLVNERAIKSASGTTRDASDGRIANRLRNREHVIHTFIELVNEGKEANLDELTERSGVARRSIYRYFDDLSELAIQGVWRVIKHAAEDAVLGNPGVGPLPERISTFAAIRIQKLAKTHAFGLLARRRLADLDGVEAGLTVVSDLARVQLTEQFGPELNEMDDDRRNRVLDTMLVMTSFESYDMLTRQLGRPVDAVETTWNEAIDALLSAG
jgi:AcrR family transcriptional regulator